MHEDIYLFLHIPRTGGTSVEHSISYYGDRTNDRFLKHYNYVQNFSESKYDELNIPRLSFRSLEQQKKLILLSGHSVFCNSHRWLRIKRTPKIFSVIRNPIERILSSFNYRYTKEVLCQDKQAFSSNNPPMDEWAVRQQKSSSDYETLYQYYEDVHFEHNLQCKWLIKSFVTNINNTWQPHPEYVFGPDVGLQKDDAIPMTWPSWMYLDNDTIDWYKFSKNFFEKIWWLTTTKSLDLSIPAFCEHTRLDYTPTRMNTSEIKRWTHDEVMNQPDIDKLIKAERHDMKLFETAERWIRPF